MGAGRRCYLVFPVWQCQSYFVGFCGFLCSISTWLRCSSSSYIHMVGTRVWQASQFSSSCNPLTPQPLNRQNASNHKNFRQLGRPGGLPLSMASDGQSKESRGRVGYTIAIGLAMKTYTHWGLWELLYSSYYLRNAILRTCRYKTNEHNSSS